MDSFLRNSAIFLEMPAVSRNTCGSNPLAFPSFLYFVFFIFRQENVLQGCVPRPRLRYQIGLVQTVQNSTVQSVVLFFEGRVQFRTDRKPRTLQYADGSRLCR